MTANDEGQELVFVSESQGDVSGFPQSAADVAHLLHHVAVQLLLLFQLRLLTLLKLHLQLQQGLVHVREGLADLGDLPLEELPVAVLSVQVVRHSPADGLQQPRRVLRLQLGDDEVVPHDGVALLQGPTRKHVGELKQHLALLGVHRLFIVSVRDKEVVEGAVGDLRLEGPGVDCMAKWERCEYDEQQWDGVHHAPPLLLWRTASGLAAGYSEQFSFRLMLHSPSSRKRRRLLIKVRGAPAGPGPKHAELV